MSFSILPRDIAHKIASSLEVFDLCSLGSCSRYWREVCGSDCVWKALCKDRWPELSVDGNSSASNGESHGVDQEVDSNSKGWRGVYISKHSQMAKKADLVTNFAERALDSESIEVGDYLQAINLLNLQQFGFKDVRMFFLKPKLNVLLNLVALHYCIICLGVLAEYVMEALDSSKISRREVYVRRFYGLRYKYDSLYTSLGELAGFNKKILGMLHRGAIHEVIHVQICATPTCPYWPYQRHAQM